MLAPQETLEAALRRRGVTRRQFLGFCSAMAALLGLPGEAAAQMAKALSGASRPVLVWLEFQDCAGNSESMLRSNHPTVAHVVLELLSWRYHDLIMAAAGKQAEAALDTVLKEDRGTFIAVVEGAIPMADGGVYCTIAGRTALDIVRDVCPKAAWTVAVGACAWDGGLVRAAPNPTGAVGVGDAVRDIKLVNLGGCPHNVANTAAMLLHYLTYGDMPAVDEFHRPLFAYGRIIHDQCERRAHYDAGRFVERWDDEGARRGWCLYHMGCKGPVATYNCPTVRWNDATSWPVKAGHGCIACASYRFWDVDSPFYERLPNVPGFGFDVSAGKIGGGLVIGVGAAVAAHATISAIRARVRPPRRDGGGPTVEAPKSTKEDGDATRRD
jgi:hydrogenase small subunit